MAREIDDEGVCETEEDWLAVFSPKHSIAKTLSWRALATVITACVAWVVTDEIRVAATVGLLDALIKFGAYYAHERIWNRIPFGQATPPKETI